MCLTFFVNGHHSSSGKQAHFFLQYKKALLWCSKPQSLNSTSEYGAPFSLKFFLNLGPCRGSMNLMLLRNYIFIFTNLLVKFIFFKYECKQQSTVGIAAAVALSLWWMLGCATQIPLQEWGLIPQLLGKLLAECPQLPDPSWIASAAESPHPGSSPCWACLQPAIDQCWEGGLWLRGISTNLINQLSSPQSLLYH